MVNKDKVFFNKTLLYLLPTLKYYGEDLVSYLRKFKMVGCFLGDDNLKRFTSSLFVVFDLEPSHIKIISEHKKDFTKFVKWAKQKDFYLYDYSYQKDGHIFHIVVFDIPNKFNRSFIKFMVDRYSEMYEEEDIKKYFEETGGLVYKNYYRKTLEVLRFDNENRRKEELDFKVDIRREILNYKEK